MQFDATVKFRGNLSTIAHFWHISMISQQQADAFSRWNSYEYL